MVFSALVLLSQLATGQLFVGFSFSQEYMTNAANKTGAILCGNHANQTGGGPLEQVGKALAGIFGAGENRSQYLETSPSPFFHYTAKSTRT